MHPLMFTVQVVEQVSVPDGLAFIVALAQVSPLRFVPSHISPGSICPLPQSEVEVVVVPPPLPPLPEQSHAVHAPSTQSIAPVAPESHVQVSCAPFTHGPSVLRLSVFDSPPPHAPIGNAVTATSIKVRLEKVRKFTRPPARFDVDK